MMKRLLAAVLGAALAFSMVPIAPTAFGEELRGGAGQVELEAGAYVEHEAVAYVAGAESDARTLSAKSSALDGAEVLMPIDSDVASAVFADDAFVDGLSNGGAAFSRASSGDSDGALVLVRDEAKSTEELIAELEADERVVTVAPNTLIDDTDPEAWVLDETKAAIGQPFPSEAVAASEAVDVLHESGTDNAAVLAASGGETSDASPSANSGRVSDLTPFQWGNRNDGSLAGLSSPEEAFDMDYGRWNSAGEELGEAVVAVVDSGVDASHPDLAPVMWTDATGKLQGVIEGADKHGFSSDPTKNSYEELAEPGSSEGAHGTHVAGIVAAAWNGEGTSGVAPNARLMSVRHGDSLASALQCFSYVNAALDAGVNVRAVNCSWTTGASATRLLDVAVTQLGQKGAVVVFASGNNGTDYDTALGSFNQLIDNPYAVVVNSYDPGSTPSTFTNYGVRSTDVMAPGGNSLSTYPVGTPAYLGEGDPDAALYESFDEDTEVADGVQDASGDAVSGGGPVLRFTVRNAQGEEGATSEVVRDGMRFDGEGAATLPYDPADASMAGVFQTAFSQPLDLSGLEEKPKYLSVRATAYDEAGNPLLPQVLVSVRLTEGPAVTLPMKGSFGMGGASWAGQYVELPENTDFERFQISLAYGAFDASIVGGAQQVVPRSGTVVLDSIGLGSDLVPYAYTQGTSMAAPEVSGAACVLAGLYPDDTADVRAARLKGAAQKADAFEDLCSTGGYATVDNAADPSPVPVSASVEGGQAIVEAFFVPDDVQVAIDGRPCVVVEREDEIGGTTRLAVELPAGFSGGVTEVRVEDPATGDYGRVFAYLGAPSDAVYYDQTNMPLPEEMKLWDSWQLVGFAGDVYALPQAALFNQDVNQTFMERYDPERKAWERVDLPRPAVAGNVVAVTGATFGGELVVQLTMAAGEGAYTTSLWSYDAKGAWHDLGIALDENTGLPLGTLASTGDELYLFGGYGTFGAQTAPGVPLAPADSTTIARVDLESDSIEVVGHMLRARCMPSVAYRDGVFLAGGGVTYVSQGASAMGVERIASVGPAAETGEGGEGYGEELSSSPVRFSTLVTETGSLNFAVASVENGFMAVGAESDDGKADTYTIPSEEEALPAAYGKRAASDDFLLVSATAYEGTLYALGSTTSEPYWTFSSTAVETASQPGDYIPVSPERPDIEEDSSAPDVSAPPAVLPATGDTVIPFVIGGVALVVVAALVVLVVAAVKRRR